MAVVDGSLYAHNPALIAYINARKLFPEKVIEVYSLGTGLLSPEQLNAELKGRGLLHWLFPILGHIQIGGTEADSTILHKLLNEEGEQNFFRLNVTIEKPHTTIDDTSPENLLYLHERAKSATKTETFTTMLKRLKSGRV